jgi:SAM-dependent methyltransferase
MNHLMKQIRQEITSVYNEDVCDYRGAVINKKHVTEYFLESYNRNKEIVRYVSRIGAGKKILDIGMGYGFYDIILKEGLGLDVTGLEIKENVPVYCRLAQAHGIGVIPGMLSKEPLPIQDCSFDFVIFSEVLEHLRISPFGAMSEIRRILKPEGLLLLTTPNVGRLTNILKLLAGFNPTPPFPDDDVGLNHITDRIPHIREYTLDELKKLIVRAEFNVVLSGYSLAQDKVKFWKKAKWKRQIIKLSAIPLLAMVPSLRKMLVVLAKKPL